jgi:hypothetical protein
MTDREAIEWLVEYLDDYYDELYTTDELTPDVANVCLSALQEREERSKLSPCDVCIYNPPSSLDGKPCTMCPACGADR